MVYKRSAVSVLAIAVLAISVICYGPQAHAASDLIGYWNFDEASGPASADSSSNSNHGTFSGAGVTHSTVLPPTSCFVNTHSVMFDGSGDYVSIADNASMDPTNAISISFWMNPNTVSNGYQHIVFKQGPVVTSYGVWLANDHIYMEDNDNSIRGMNSNSAVTAGAWHYITVTYDGTTQGLYIDGVLDNSQVIPGITLTYTNSPVKIGSGDYNNPFAGYVDDLRIYNRALTAGEIADMAAGGCGPGVAAAAQNNPTPSTPSSTNTPVDSAQLSNTGSSIIAPVASALSLILVGAMVAWRSRHI